MCQRIKPSRVNQKNILPREYTHASEIRVNIKKDFFSHPNWGRGHGFYYRTNLRRE